MTLPVTGCTPLTLPEWSADVEAMLWNITPRSARALRLADLPIPEPAPDEVRVKISGYAEYAILPDAFAYAIPAR